MLVAEADKFVLGLSSLVADHPKSNFYATAQDEEGVKRVKEVFCNQNPENFVNSDLYSRNFLRESSLENFDFILSSPDFGFRTLCSDSYFICREPEMVALENLLYHLNKNGTLCIVVPGRITFSQGSIGNLRKHIQNHYKLEEIIELPKNVFLHTGIKTFMIKIKNAEPDNTPVSIKKYTFQNQSLVLDNQTQISLKELKELDSWNVERIFCGHSDEWKNFYNSPIPKVRLGDVAEIFRGKNVVGKTTSHMSATKSLIGVINISNIGEYKLNDVNMDYIDETERMVSRYILHDGDMLLPARGTTLRTSVFYSNVFSIPCIPSANVMAIRPKPEKLNSVYLKIFLDSSFGRRLINAVQQGIDIMNLNASDLENMIIPLPRIEQQKIKAQQYERGLRQYQEAIDSAETLWKKTLSELEQF